MDDEPPLFAGWVWLVIALGMWVLGGLLIRALLL